MQIKIAGLVEDSITDGPGLRSTLFVQGCPHHCPGCHNPQTWAFDGGSCKTPAEIYQKIKKNPLTKGVTLSGGEPFCQAAALSELAKMLKKDGYEIAVYSGYLWEELVINPEACCLLEQIDILVDGRFIEQQKSWDLKCKGSQNQRILDVPKSLTLKKPVLSQKPGWGNTAT